MVEQHSKILELKEENEKLSKLLLSSEIIIGILACTILFIPIILAEYFIENTILNIVLISIATILFLISCLFMLKIEQIAGFYHCKNCDNKYIPSYKNVLLAPHIFRTRYMRCPECEKKTWQKKVLK